MLKNSVSVYLGLSASELSTNLWNYPFASILLGNMASSACDSPNYWVKLITGGPVLNRLQIFSLENLVLKVLQLTVGCCLSTTLLLAKESTSNPNILCSEPNKKKLIQQFQQIDLDIKFVDDFCQRFGPTHSKIPHNFGKKINILLPNKKLQLQSFSRGLQQRKFLNEENKQKKLASEQIWMAVFTSQEPTTTDALSSKESYYQESDYPENLKNNVSLDNNSVYQQDTNNFIEKNHHFNKTGAPKWDFSSGLIWQLNIGQAKTSFFETDKGARLEGNHLEIRLQKFLTPLLLSGISQSYRNQQGILRKMNLTRAIDLEQFQLLGNLGIAWEANNDLGLRGGLMGGWSENRLSYQLQKDEKAYFSDSIENGQFTWGFEFGPTFKFMERWRVGLRWQKHNSITAVRFAEGNKATLHPLHTYLIWAEYIVETR